MACMTMTPLQTETDSTAALYPSSATKRAAVSSQANGGVSRGTGGQAAKRSGRSASNYFWEVLGRGLDVKTRLYLNAVEEFHTWDLLMLIEILTALIISELYLRVVLPSLGLISNSPCPWVGSMGRPEMFIYGPLGYTVMYWGICGSIDLWYTKLYPEVGRQLSLQNKPMSEAEKRKARSFSMKSIASTTAMSGYFYHAMRGETNIRFGMPEARELPWLVLAYLVVDIMAYLVHRLLHRPWWYARVHKVHHLWKAPNAWVVSALHPAELLMLSLPMMMTLVAMPLNFFTLIVFLLLYYICNVIDHSGMDLHHLLFCRLLFWQAPSEFHDNHHAHFHANYGAMVDWWDRLGGTYYHPKSSGVTLCEDQFASVRELRQRRAE